MKLYIKSILAGTMLMVSSTAMLAQYTNSAYFTENHLYRHELNPAFGSEKGYVSLPILGNINFGLQGNLNLENVLYNVNGKTATFLHPEVSTEEVLKNISDENKMLFDMKIGILSAGFKAFGGYNTFAINMRTSVGLNLPGNLFRMAKEDITSKEYDLSGLNAQANAFAEIALGHSRKVMDNLTVGAKLKFLLGGANVQANLNKALINTGNEGYWEVEANAEMKAAVKGMSFKHDTPNDKKVDGIDMDGAGLNGFGFAVDLGAEYEVMEGLKVSAALTDLGTIKWSNVIYAKNARNKFQLKDYTFGIDDDVNGTFEDDMEKLTDDLGEIADLTETDGEAYSTGIGTTLRIGAEYKMPFYDKLSVGGLLTSRMGDYSWTEFRLSANVAPIKMLSAGLNLGMGTYGTNLGWIIDFHPTGFGLFLAMDKTIGSVSKQFIPLKSNASFSMGINIPF